MVKSMNDIREEIFKKNMMLEALNHGNNSNSEKVKLIIYELDRLLYQYYKLLKC